MCSPNENTHAPYNPPGGGFVLPGIESLEGRALMANITARGVLSFVAAGLDFDDAVQRTNSSRDKTPSTTGFS